MKRQAMHHTKMDMLMRLLGIRRYEAVGILESLWHLTAREAPCGNIGKLSNMRIAIGIEWRGAANRTREHEADRLVQGLTEAGWLDSDPHQRLTVHDWHEHADDSVKKYLKRNGLDVTVSGHVATSRDMARLPAPAPEPVPEPSPKAISPQAVAEFPNSVAFLRKRFAASVDDALVRVLVDKSVQAVIGAGEDPKHVNDRTLLIALQECTRKEQHSAALYLSTVPNWMRNKASA